MSLAERKSSTGQTNTVDRFIPVINKQEEISRVKLFLVCFSKIFIDDVFMGELVIGDSEVTLC